MIAPYITIQIMSIVVLYIVNVYATKMPSSVVNITNIVCFVLITITFVIISDKWDNMTQKFERLEYRIEQLEDSKESETE